MDILIESQGDRSFELHYHKEHQRPGLETY